jgi:uncharacterized protein (TIGR03083 family)
MTMQTPRGYMYGRTPVPSHGMSDQLTPLHTSAAHLRAVVTDLDPAELERSAYPTEWTIADVVSHLGSGAVILQRRLDDALAGTDTPDDFAPEVWAEWNAKSPAAQAADGLQADADLVARLDAIPDAERETFSVPFGPLTLDFERAVGLRLNEHALHTWDVDVTLDPRATLLPSSTACVIDNLETIARFIGRPTGEVATVEVHTLDPVRDFRVSLTADAVSLIPAEPGASGDLVLPAEAFIRLVYGRLDPDHTPETSGDADLDGLRRAFPGI